MKSDIDYKLGRGGTAIIEFDGEDYKFTIEEVDIERECVSITITQDGFDEAIVDEGDIKIVIEKGDTKSSIESTVSEKIEEKIYEGLKSIRDDNYENFE